MVLKEDFYARDGLTLARDLLGRYLVRESGQGQVITKIVETEAYIGPEDKACHAYDNRRTKRTEVMFGRPGLAYVYLVYGIHNCFNIVAASEGKPEAVLIRAVEPVKGLDFLRENRAIGKRPDRELTNGPGKLTEALNINRDYNGISLTGGRDLYLTSGIEVSESVIQSGPRINIDYAEEYKDKNWRFFIDSDFISG
ncbi:DNA-3-methyladenine glycosylase [Halanaerobiaceae bacterium Z-7014]|uniref:Putative 3-methyladenine DNA glycosylase n=1 Tax=Halonatronomonas betaini TaxID=2778430 RepID=A0A931AQ20_9FIRM|nr:DNA-3-methyladenine glycosylase [Halonatronomonas betaini]MBF8436397.1 DNA-3-methyladenine glycosylase [Halonatronomonas betaini]